MTNHPSKELRLRSKSEMAKDIAEIISCLHHGHRSAVDLLIEDLKTRALFFDENIQQDVLVFIEQVMFQETYDPWHKVTAEVQKAADKLLEDLGFKRPTLN